MHTHLPLATIKIVYPNNKVKNEKLSSNCKVSCCGEDEASKHPKVFISLKSGTGKCPYCGTIFKKTL